MKTYGELMKEMSACVTEDQARTLVENETTRLVTEADMSATEAMGVTLHNIGYLAGYFERKETQRILALFGVGHPVFGRGLSA